MTEPNTVWKREYEKHYTTPYWRDLRFAALRRSEGKCERCGAQPHFNYGAGLKVHHVTYERVGRELLDDVLVVCGACHGALHTEPVEADEYEDWLNLDRWPGPWPPPEWEAA